MSAASARPSEAIAEEAFDVVIVGAGSAGCALAGGLAEETNLSVLLLEAGGSDQRFWIKTPIGYGVCFHDPGVNWRYRTEPDAGLGGRTDYWPRGKVVGGSSSINAMVYCRGLREDFEDWRAAGNPGWGWDEVAPAYDALERRAAPISGGGEVAGAGALSVEDRSAEHHPIRRSFFAAARAIGLPATDSMNGDAPEGVGPYEITTRRGVRCSSADAFLRPALRRPNLTLRRRAQATRILFEGSRAVGVEYVRRGARFVAHARASVVLSAGAIGSPHLLQLSGVGPGGALRRLGVDPVRAVASVGGWLQDHLGIEYLVRAKVPTLNQTLGSVRGQFWAGLRYVLSRSGPLSLSLNQSGGLVRSRRGAPRPDQQLYFNPLTYSVVHRNKRHLYKPDDFPGFAIGYNACRPTSRGRIEAASPDPFAPPEIRPGYLSTAEDEAAAIDGARLVGRLLDAEPLREITRAPPPIALSTASEDEILEDFKARSGSVYHPCGTCRMAPEADGGVVDHRLRVHGMEGLRVVDASVFPNVTSANTNAPSIMVGRRAVRLLREDLV